MELVLQVLFIEYGQIALNISYGGLTGKQWGICFGFSAIVFVTRFIIIFIPMEGCIEGFFKLILCNKNNKVSSEDSDDNMIMDKLEDNRLNQSNHEERKEGGEVHKADSKKATNIISQFVKKQISKQLSRGISHQSVKK